MRNPRNAPFFSLLLILGLLPLGCGGDTDPCSPDPCVGHSTCVEAEGIAECLCDVGYDGAGCNDCAWGYQDRDGDTLCLPACGGAALITCPLYMVCDDSSGEATCACDTGYTGPSCQDCDTGYAPDANGDCLPVP